MKIVVLMTCFALVVSLAGCPAVEEDPGQGVRDTFEQMLTFTRNGEYDKTWTLFSVEFREKINQDLVKQKAGLRESLAKNAYDVEKWVLAQTGMTAEQYLAASAREILAANLKITRKDALRSRIVGKIHVEGDFAVAHIVLPPAEDPAEFRFVFRNDRWLYYERSVLSVK